MNYPEVAVGAVIENSRGEILFLRSKKWNQKLIVPGGHLETGETLVDAVKREIKEETSLDVEVLDLIETKEHIFPSDFHRKAHFIFFSYLCKAKSNDAKAMEDDTDEIVWIMPQDAILRSDLNDSSLALVKKYLVAKKNAYLHEFKKLYELEKKLRTECPWDKKQTIKTMLEDLKSEISEFEEAIDKSDLENVKEELGDIFQCLMLIVAIAEESNEFTIAESIKCVIEKMIRRHPHVFGELRGKHLTAEEVTKNWREIKKKEKGH
ncbi:MAG: NUDIX domain-containing protein [archaeon]